MNVMLVYFFSFFYFIEALWLLEFPLEKLVIAWEFFKQDLMNCGESMRHIQVSTFIFHMTSLVLTISEISSILTGLLKRS